jgi:hypothetical protein
MPRHVYYEGSAEDLPLPDCSGSTPVVLELSFFPLLSLLFLSREDKCYASLHTSA